MRRLNRRKSADPDVRRRFHSQKKAMEKIRKELRLLPPDDPEAKESWTLIKALKGPREGFKDGGEGHVAPSTWVGRLLGSILRRAQKGDQLSNRDCRNLRIAILYGLRLLPTVCRLKLALALCMDGNEREKSFLRHVAPGLLARCLPRI
jgi:hypothetical protein